MVMKEILVACLSEWLGKAYSLAHLPLDLEGKCDHFKVRCITRIHIHHRPTNSSY